MGSTGTVLGPFLVFFSEFRWANHRHFCRKGPALLGLSCSPHQTIIGAISGHILLLHLDFRAKNWPLLEPSLDGLWASHLAWFGFVTVPQLGPALGPS